MIGTAVLKEDIKHTEFIFGDKKTLAGKTLPLIDIVDGDHLCLFSITGIITIDERDIKNVTMDNSIKPLSVLKDTWNVKDIEEMNKTISMFQTRQNALDEI